MKSPEVEISFLEFLFSGSLSVSIVIGLLFFLGVLALYLFLYKYFYLKEVHNKNNDFLENIADCLYDHRIEAAVDWCKRVSTPESRIVRKGLDKIGKSNLSDLNLVMLSQQELEILRLRKNGFIFSFLTKFIFLLGFLGTGIGLVSFFMSGNIDLRSVLYYTSFFPICIGIFLSIIVLIFRFIINTILYNIIQDLKDKGNKFIEILAEI